MHAPCMTSHAWLIHDSWVLLFNVFFKSYFKIVFILQGDYPLFLFFFVFVFDPVFLLFCYLFLLISWAIIFVQNRSRRRQEEYLYCWLWTAYLRRYCMKDVRRNIFIKHFVGGLKYMNLFVTFLWPAYSTFIWNFFI